ncbi:MAG: hypothetical protein OEZ01_06990 [Candidatus Heimdallarchaeota archaeon]|nr:hypothetical protein [Candidatus Heimdallarchaeota archaeon]
MPDRDKIPYGTSISSLLVSIVRQAQADGVITKDESELINRIQIDARDLEAKMVQAKKDGLSLDDVLANSRTEIIKNATEIAKRDGVISNEEEAILNRLIKELENVKIE